ncbi:hypothetical protein IKF57_02375 [Candidatus Saccharibacteria bacterium]|nr:hypothetical protein [Candidatus Saccharibacteria bacterium]
MKKIIAKFIWVAVFSLVFWANVSADNKTEMDVVMTISPSKHYIVLTPGETYKGVITVNNTLNSKRDLKYSLSIGSFGLDTNERGEADYNSVDISTVTQRNQMMDWIKLEKTTGMVSPNTADRIAYTITVPETAAAGGQYASIIVRDITEEDGEQDNRATIQSVVQFASLLIAEVSGDTTEVGSVVENTVPMISFGGPVIVSSKVKNEGNVHTDAKYILEVSPFFSGEVIYSNEEEPASSLVLPESEKYNTLSWDEAPTVGIFKVRQTVSIFDDVSTVERIVIICPLWLLFVIIFGVVGGVVWMIVKWRERAKILNGGSY